jgi:hypothetical protein
MNHDGKPQAHKKAGWADRIDNLLTKAESLNTQQINELKDQFPGKEQANE